MLSSANQLGPVFASSRMLGLAQASQCRQQLFRTSIALFSCDVTIVGGGPTGVCAGALLRSLSVVQSAPELRCSQVHMCPARI